MDQCAPVHLGTRERCVRPHVPPAVQLVITLIPATVQVSYRMQRSSPTVYLSWLPIPSACQCQNGGTCNGSVCACPPGYMGTLCETSCATSCLTGYYLNTCNCTCTLLDAKVISYCISIMVTIHPPIYRHVSVYVCGWVWCDKR